MQVALEVEVAYALASLFGVVDSIQAVVENGSLDHVGGIGRFSVAEATEVSVRGWWLASRCRRAWRVPSELELEGSSALVATEKQCHPHPCGRARLHPLALKGTGFNKDIPRVCWWCGREGEAVG